MSKAVLWPFQFSTDQAFVIEVGPNYFRFLLDDVFVYVSGTGTGGVDGVPYEVWHPYAESELFDVKFTQINDVVKCVHPNHPPYTLTRVANNNWTMVETAWVVPATLDENVTSNTITPQVNTDGTYTLFSKTAGGAPVARWVADHVDSYWRLGWIRNADTTKMNISSATSSAWLKTLGAWNFRTYGTWTADILLQRSYDGGTTYSVIRKIVGVNDRNVDTSGDAETDASYRIVIQNYVSNTDGRLVFESPEALIYATFKLNTFIVSSTVKADLFDPLPASTATNLWSEGAWSKVRGYPRAVALHEQRIVYGGSLYEPTKMWGSTIGDYDNFNRASNPDGSASDDDSWAFTIVSRELNGIQWMVSQKDLLVGTMGAEWVVSSRSSEKPITPTTVSAQQQSSYGSEYIQALVTNEVVLFIERGARKVREMVYNLAQSQFIAADLTLLSEHVSEGGIVQIARQAAPIPILWAVTGNGALIGLTYQRDQEVIGWHRHKTDNGFFEAVCTIYGKKNQDDEVYVVVRRTINGNVERYIEKLDPVPWTNRKTSYFVDCGFKIDGASPATEFTGMQPLAGMQVVVLADGEIITGKSVSVDGVLTLDQPAQFVRVGFGYEGRLQPMRFDRDNSIGATAGHTLRGSELLLRVKDSLTLRHDNGDNVFDHSFNESVDDTLKTAAPFTGDSKVDWQSDYSTDCTLILRHNKPLPLNLLMLYVKHEATK
jgi:hypothetical protein